MIIKSLRLILVGFFLCNISSGESKKISTNDTLTQLKGNDVNETVLKYEEFLEKEREADRIYTIGYYDTIWKLLAAAVFIGGGVFTWLNWKSKEDIKKQVNEQFKERIQGIFDEKLSQIDDIIKEGKEKSAKQFEAINKIILELSIQPNKLETRNTEGIAIQEDEKRDVDKLIGKKVLCVADFPENNDYPRQILEEAGIKFTMALSTEEAMKILQNQKFDLIVSDMGRGTNYSAGLDLLKQLRARNIDTKVVIYCSTKGIANYGQEALKLGAVAVTNGHSRILSVVQKLLS